MGFKYKRRHQTREISKVELNEKRRKKSWLLTVDGVFNGHGVDPAVCRRLKTGRHHIYVLQQEE